MEERAYWLAWSQISGVGPVLLGRIRQHFHSLAVAWDAPVQELLTVEGIGDRLAQAIAQARSRLNPDQLLTQHLKKNPQFWTPADPDYPRLLLEIPSPPPVLYYRGQVDPRELAASKPIVAIVGTRYPTEYGRRWTHRISTALAKHGFTIVSGMAAGIDTEAHRGCLEAGGRTIAVLGTGLDLVYPPQNRKLYEEILQQGLLLSEYPAGTKPDRGHFPARNRIIAGLSRAVLVMEAPQQSGALITARLANDFCREVFTLPGSLDNEQALGCLALLGRGANAILGEGQLLEMLGMLPQVDEPASQTSLPLPQLEPELAQVLAAIAFEPMPLDLIAQKAGLSASAASAALLQLELFGLVAQLPGMRYQRIG